MSDTIKIAVAMATEDQLRWFATNQLNLEVSPKDNAAKLKVAIARAWDDTDITVPADIGGKSAPAPAARKVDVAALVPKDSHRDPKVTILVNRQEGPGGDRPVEVGVNGTLILIPRGEPVTVAYRYYEALKNAVQTIYDQGADGEISARDVHAYPFQVITMPDRSEVDAWITAQAS